MTVLPTPHLSAKQGEVAKTVLMPGDPLRAKYISENFLTDSKCINQVRNMLGYTGKYKGQEVSVMPSGMGTASMGIYSYELFNFYGVENIIRIGSAGAISDNLKLRDIVVGLGACTDSNFSYQYNLDGIFAPVCSYKLLKKASEVSDKINIKINIGNILSSDVFYNEGHEVMTKWKNMGVLAVEMEAAALYMNAARSGKNALCICTISDHIFSGESCSSKEREISFADMMKLALEISLEI
ncbi:MAG: purine-nucleoside phosphorylase [Oscillospiraceae bacterium]|nr:purine-nucleoside phosphorylase [Oscillospiraceae bacterium]